MQLDIIENQIWIQQNNTEIYVDRELIQRGIAPQGIILGFRSPSVLGETLSPAQERLLKLLVTLIESFEERHYQLKAATPLEILTELVSDCRRQTKGQRGLKQKDLIRVFGSQGVASEVLNGKRGISKTQAKELGEFFKVSPTLFFD